MSKANIFTLILLAVPLLNYAVLYFFSNTKFSSLTCKILPWVFLALLVKIFGSSSAQDLALNYDFDIFDNFKISFTKLLNQSFELNSASCKFLLILNLFWLVFVFYQRGFVKFFAPVDAKFLLKIELDFAFFLAVLMLCAAANNIFVFLIFYCAFLLKFVNFLSYFVENSPNNSLPKNSSATSLGTFLSKFDFSHLRNFLGALVYLKYFAILALAILLFFENSQISQSFDHESFLLIKKVLNFALVILIILPIFIAQAYFFKSSIEPIFSFVAYSFVYFCSGFLLLIKVVELAILPQQILNIIQILFLLAALLAIVAISVSKTIKHSFLHLLFWQAAYSLFAAWVFSFEQGAKIFLTLAANLGNSALLFFSFSNLMLFLKVTNDKNLRGLFYKAKLSSSFLLVALVSAAGFLPGLSLVNSMSLTKIAAENNLSLFYVVLLANFLVILLFFVKMILPFFYKDFVDHSQEKLPKNNETNKVITQKIGVNEIDSESELILSLLVIVLAMTASGIFYKFLF